MTKLEKMQEQSRKRHVYDINNLQQQLDLVAKIIDAQIVVHEVKPFPKKIKVIRTPDASLLYHLRKLYDEGVIRVEERDKKQNEAFEKAKIDYDKLMAINSISRERKREVNKWIYEPKVHPDEKKTFVRPPAQYTNNPSPFGIADELHGKK